MKRTIIGAIPARMASTRFPGKPMAKILGMPMIGHVYHRCKMSKMLDEVYVATCDKEIFDYITSIGGKAIMTRDTHERCSDRIAEAVKDINADIIVMVQGDEPMVFPEMIDMAVEPMLHDPSVKVVNLMGKIKTREEFEDPNEVKVVVDRNSDAIYFSREPIPSNKKYSGPYDALKQICIIPFTRECLYLFDKLEPTPLEIIESVDMNRFIEHGYKVRMVLSDSETYSVDTPEDLKFVEEKMMEDHRMESYRRT